MEREISNEKFSELRQYAEKYRPQIEKSLRDYLPAAPSKIESEFNELIEVALFSGGKRLRPILTLLGAELFGGKAEDVLPSAVAVEFIYTSSKILDDLPVMNNAKTLTGRISPAEKYGEGLAILVALALLNASYPLVFVNHIGTPERAMQAHQEIVECIGASGVIGDQTVGLMLGKSANLNDFSENDFERKSTKNLKTSALMRLPLRVGAILAGADYLDLANLSRVAGLLGDAYVLSDNLIDLCKIFNENKTFDGSQGKASVEMQLNNLIEEVKRLLIENFPSNEARSGLIQLSEYFAESKA